MRTPRPVRAVLAALTAALLLAPTAAVAHTADAARHDPPGLPATYGIDPAGTANPLIFPEGIAARGTTFFVGSTTDGTIYRGSLLDDEVTPFLPGGQDGRTSAVGMKIDGRTLFVAGGATGRVFAYDTTTGELTGTWSVADPGPEDPTFLNDLIVTRTGDVYVTDSRRPVLYRIDADDRATDGVEPLPVFVSFAGSPIEYAAGFNVGGIAASPDGRSLVLAQSNTRRLFRVDLHSRTVTAIDLGGELVGADGLVLRGSRSLYAIERQGDVGYVVEIRLDRDLSSGEVVGRTPDATFDDPTTAARIGGYLLVVNSQFGARNAGTQPGPFTVSRVRVP